MKKSIVFTSLFVAGCVFGCSSTEAPAPVAEPSATALATASIVGTAGTVNVVSGGGSTPATPSASASALPVSK